MFLKDFLNCTYFQPTFHSSQSSGPKLQWTFLSINTWGMGVIVGSSVQFSHSVVSDSLRFHGLQHVRPSSPLPTPGACSDSCPLNWWCHPLINHLILCCPLFLLPSIFPSIRVFSNESVLHIGLPKDWSFSFSISPSDEYSGLISIRIDWFDLLQSKGFSRVFYNTTVQKHQFSGVQFSL